MPTRQAPQRVRAEQLTGEYPAELSPNDPKTSVNIDGHWVKCRGMGLDTIPTRLMLAWDVFRGKADALYWYKQ